MGKYTLSEVAPIKQGAVNPAEQYWLLNLDMVESNTGRIIDYLYVPSDEIGSSTISFDAGNVLYSKLRPYLNKVVLPEKDGYATSEMLPLRPDPAILTREYLTYFLRSPQFVAYINEKTSGAKMPRANTSDLKAVEIDCPSLDEQRKITAIFDNIVRIIETRQMELQKLDELVKARFVEMFGDPISNDKHLPMMQGVSFFKLSNGKFVSESKRYGTGIPVYGGNGISWYTDEALVDGDTLVVGRVGFQSGNVHYAKGPLWVSDNAMYISFYKETEYDLLFLCHLMEHIDFTRHQDAGDLKKITQKPFMAMEYIHPTLSQQREYTSFVKQVDKSKAVVQEALDKAQLLFDSLMQAYFG